MSRRAHVLWLIAVVASGAVFIFSLGSDVWEAYGTIAGATTLGYGIAWWRNKNPRANP